MRVFFSILVLFIYSLPCTSQCPNVEWQQNYGGNGTDAVNAIVPASNNGYLLGGYSNGSSNDVSEIYFDYDCWVVKVDENGIIQWEQNYGGFGLDLLETIVATPDNGFLLGSRSSDPTNDVSSNFGGHDYWVVKIDQNGTIQWEQNYGGTNVDALFSIVTTTDNGFLLGGYTISSSNDVSQNYGGGDYWVVKIDENGIIQWEQNYGGSNLDNLQSVVATSDNGFLLGGFSNSSSNDVSQNYGEDDYWVVKIDENGIIQWEQNYGGTGSDILFEILPTSDSGFLLGGQSNSSSNDVSQNYGEEDYWVVKIDQNGTIQWEQNYGGTGSDILIKILPTSDNGFILGGHSNSSSNDVSQNYGEYDFWIVKINENGNILWEQNYGGTKDDIFRSLLETSDGSFLLGGQTYSSDGDITSNYGFSDMWVVKISGDLHPDYNALMDLYNSTNGDQWTNTLANDNVWDQSCDPCDGSWYGIECRNNRVTCIDMWGPTDCVLVAGVNNNLSGSLPSSIEQLDSLENLILQLNNIGGTIPSSIANLQNLKVLHLGNNEFDSPIPPELYTMQQLETLDLQGNNFNEVIPSDIGQLSNLNYLHLGGNSFSGEILNKIQNLTNLESITLGPNQFEGTIPTALGNMTNLSLFIIAENNFSGEIPNEFGNLANLSHLSLASNQLSGEVPASIGQLPLLTQAYFQQNDLEGCFFDFVNPQICDLALTFQNVFTENPKMPWNGFYANYCDGVDQIGAPCNDGDDTNGTNDIIQADCSCGPDICTHPDYLFLIDLYNSTNGDQWTNTINGDNPWDQSCDPCDGTWYGIQCDNNRVTCIDMDGTVSCDLIGNSGNNLTGTLPTSIGNLDSLEYLILSYNNLSGVLPTSIGNLQNLKSLQLAVNNFESPIPLEFFNLQKLEILILSNNNFSESISQRIDQLIKLKDLRLGDNSFNNQILNKLTSLNELEFVYLANNQFEGEIPSTIDNLTNLIFLNIRSNNFSGELPNSLGNMFALRSLLTNGNNLSGVLPASLGNLVDLNTLELNNNNFEGCLDPNLLNLCNIPTLRLYNNPLLPWEGDETMFCDGEDQIGAPCNDGDDTNGTNDVIRADCSCGPEVCIHPDYIALMELYNSTNGDQWTSTLANDGVWDLSCDPCDGLWYGVECANGRVSQLNLNANNLAGSLPNLSFENLRIFNISDNQISGQIPLLNEVPSLLEFYVNQNDLEGNIPELDQVPNLTHFECEGNRLIGDIPELDLIPQIFKFNCSDNNLSGLIPTLDQVPNIDFFSCAGNILTGGIPSLDQVPNLRFFACAINVLSGSLPNLESVPNLQNFICHQNNMSGEIPVHYGNLNNLQFLTLNDNNLSGCIDPSLLNLCNIVQFELSDNPLLPWQGNETIICTGDDQIGAPCNDGDDSNGTNDEILADCTCGKSCVDINVNLPDETICFGEEFIINGNTYSTSGAVTETFQSSEGCDSIVNLFLEVLEEDVNQTFEEVQNLCEDEEMVINGITFNKNYTYHEFLFTDTNGCDSIHIVELEFDNASEDCVFEYFITPEEGIAFEGLDETVSSIVIFGRWGNKVIEIKDPAIDQTWDGRNKRGEFLPEGTYFFIVYSKGESGTTFRHLTSKQGFITLLR